jgi:hypothetical protein
MDFSNTFATDQGLELKGVWEPLEGESALLVARAGNMEYQKEFNKLPRSVRYQIENDMLSPETAGELTCELMAKTLLLGWRAMADEGATIEYSKENAKKMLIKYPDLRQFVWVLANDRKRYMAQAAVEDAKNSESASSGS